MTLADPYRDCLAASLPHITWRHLYCTDLHAHAAAAFANLRCHQACHLDAALRSIASMSSASLQLQPSARIETAILTDAVQGPDGSARGPSHAGPVHAALSGGSPVSACEAGGMDQFSGSVLLLSKHLQRGSGLGCKREDLEQVSG